MYVLLLSPVTFDVDVVTIMRVRSVTKVPIVMEHRDMAVPNYSATLLYGTAAVTCRVVRKALLAPGDPLRESR